jgi:hypothetical protein
MGILYPNADGLSAIEDATERHVVDMMMRRLSDDWFIIANFRFHHILIDHEIDLIVIHPRCGIAVIEVKGGHLSIQQGRWINNGDRAKPDEQAMKNSFALRDFLADAIPGSSFKIAWGIALPSVVEIRGALPGSMVRGQLLLSPDFDDLNWRVETLFDSINTRYDLDGHQFQRILDKICPDVEFIHDPMALQRRTRKQLDMMCEARVEALMSLSVNHRVVVTGRAGTGKTYLAIRWTQSGLMPDEDERPKRVLLTCYNDPLGFELQQLFAVPSDASDDEANEAESRIRVGPFLKIALQLEGLPSIPFENTDDREYWIDRVPRFLTENWHLVTERFDRIVVDEAQDFSPEWMSMLESLLDPEGDDTLLMVSDSRQQLIDRGFVEPSIEDGWVHAQLTTNVRSSREIALLARRFLDGAAAPALLPNSSDVTGQVISTDTELVAGVRARLGAALRDGLVPSEILVVAGDSSARDLLRSKLSLGRAEQRGDGTIPCETAHRAKGLEASLVIAAVGEEGTDDGELYVAITRAVSELFVIGPAQTLRRIGL